MHMKSTRLALAGVAYAGILSLALGSASNAAHAADLKIGLVDMQKALQTVDAGKKAKAQLEKEVGTKTKDLQNEQQSIQKAAEELKKQSLVMNEEARAKKQAELQERAMKFEQTRMKTSTELQQREQELTQPIIGKLRGIVGEVAKQKGYTLVLEKNENLVLFSQESDDMTQEVISRYNKATGK